MIMTMLTTMMMSRVMMRMTGRQFRGSLAVDSFMNTEIVLKVLFLPPQPSEVLTSEQGAETFAPHCGYLATLLLLLGSVHAQTQAARARSSHGRHCSHTN